MTPLPPVRDRPPVANRPTTTTGWRHRFGDMVDQLSLLSIALLSLPLSLSLSLPFLFGDRRWHGHHRNYNTRLAEFKNSKPTNDVTRDTHEGISKTSQKKKKQRKKKKQKKQKKKKVAKPLLPGKYARYARTRPFKDELLVSMCHQYYYGGH